MIWQKLQNVLLLIGVIVVALLPIPAVLEKETVTKMMTLHALEIFAVAPITVFGMLEAVQTAAIWKLCGSMPIGMGISLNISQQSL